MQQTQFLVSASTMVDRYYSHDHAGRLTKSEQQITGNSNGRVTVAENNYNEIGQLADKKLHKAGTYNYLQTVDYSINIRGWLTASTTPTPSLRCSPVTQISTCSAKSCFTKSPKRD
jgi:hypothetical protein